MVATSWTVILLFSRTNPFIQYAISSGLVTDGHRAFIIFNTGHTDPWKNNHKFVFFTLSALHKLLSTSEKFLENFPNLKAKSDETMLFFQVCRPFSRYDKTANRTAHTCT
jgi:hypothetical protein